MTAIARMLQEMRDLGWDGDADEWEVLVAETAREDMLAVRVDIRAELRWMRERAEAQS